MKIFIICCLLFIHMNMCIFIREFRISIRVSGIRWFGFGDGFPPKSVSGSDSDFDFEFWFRVLMLGARRLHPIRPVVVLTPSFLVWTTCSQGYQARAAPRTRCAFDAVAARPWLQKRRRSLPLGLHPNNPIRRCLQVQVRQLGRRLQFHQHRHWHLARLNQQQRNR